MAIDALRDGFVKICIDPSLNVRDQKCRLVVEGQMTTGTATPDTLIKITQVSCIDDQFGQGSVIAEALKYAIRCCGNNAVAIYALPRADVGTPAAYSLPVAGTATTDGSVDIYMGDGQYGIDDLFIPEGSTAADIAALIAAEADPNFPYTVTASGGSVVFTANNGGTVGNFLTVVPNWRCEQKTLPEGVTFGDFVQTTEGVGAPAPIGHAGIFGECCVCCYALLSDDRALQKALQDYLTEQHSCEKPQCFGHGYVYNPGSLGQVLARDSNAKVLSRLAHGTGNQILPWLRTIAFAARSCCLTVDNPEISIQGPNFGVLDCISAPEGCFPEWTQDEATQLTDAGFVTTIPVTNGCGALTSPQIVADITNNRFDSEGRENLTFRSASACRLVVQTAISLAAEIQRFNGLGFFSQNTAIREGTQGTNRRLMLGRLRAWARRNVGRLFSDFGNLNEDLRLEEDLQTAPRCQGTPGKLLMHFTYRPPVRIRGVEVNAAPELLTNC